MPTQTRMIPPRNVKVGDRMATTTGMREVLKVELLRHPSVTTKVNRVYRVDITVQDPSTRSGESEPLRYYTDRPGKVTVQRDGPVRATETREQLAERLIGEVVVEDAERAQAKRVFIEGYCFESGATKEDAETAWAAQHPEED